MQEELQTLHTMYEKALQNPKNLSSLQNYLVTTICPLVPYYESIGLDDLRKNEEVCMELQIIIQALRLVYSYSGMNTGVEDSTYDILCEKLDDVSELELEFTEPVTTLKPKGYHIYESLRGTLDKVYYLSDEEKSNGNRRSLDDWIRTSERKIKEVTGMDADLKEEYVYVFPKWDGVSVVLEYDEHNRLHRALTRGYTAMNEAIVVTDIFREIANEGYNPHKNKKAYGIKIEAMTTLDGLTEYNIEHPDHKYKNTRSFASAIINNDDGIDKDAINYLKCIKLRSSFLDEDGESLQILDPSVFQSPHLYCKLKEVDRIDAFCENNRFVNGLRCDGAVIYLINPTYQKALGRSHNKQKFEVAYKFTEEIQYATVKDIHFSVGLYGSVTPVLEIKPIVMKGNTIKHISLGSIGRLRMLNVGKGDTIKVGYDIIPTCSFDEDDPSCKLVHKEPFHIVPICPVCGEYLEIRDLTAKCTNKKCHARMMGKLKSHIQRMRIQYFGDALIEQVFHEGIVTKIPDIYKWKKKEKQLLELENFGKKKYKRILQEIESAKGRTITESQLCASLSLERLSTGTFDKLFEVMTLDDLLEIVKNEDKKALTRISGIGPITADWIIDGFGSSDVRKTLDFLQEQLHVEHINQENPFFTVVFSSFGANDERKEKVRKMIAEQKGKEVKDITKTTDFLVVPNHDVQSRKVTYAKLHQIPIFTAEEFVQKTIPLQ